MRRVALSVAIDVYDPKMGAAPLGGCVPDSNNIVALLSNLGFEVLPPLHNEAATADAVVSVIKRLQSELVPGDCLFFHGSGHGTQIYDTSGDETDRKDEASLLFDAMIVDDQFHELWSGFRPGVRIVAFHDTCHSGTLGRAENVAGWPRTDRDKEDIPLEVRLLTIGTTQDHELAGDTAQGGIGTMALVNAWNELQAMGRRPTWKQLYQRAKAKTGKRQTMSLNDYARPPLKVEPAFWPPEVETPTLTP